MIATGASPGRQAIVDFHPVASKNGIPRRPIAGVQVDPCPRRSASRSTPWGATTGPRWSFRARRWRWRSIPTARFILFGDQARIEPLLAAHPRLKAACRLVHTDVAVRMDDKPSQALRNGRWKSSMWLAIDAVKKGEADVAVSAGNTGALMAMAKFNLQDAAGHRAAGDRGAVADAQGRPASCSISAPRSAPTPSIWSTSR